jgi:hypothetical protein
VAEDTTPTPVTPTEPPVTPRFRDAYQRYLDEFRALPNSEISQVNLDVPTAVTSTLGALAEIRALRPQIASEIPSFDLVRFDKLEGYTLALGHAHALYLAASEPTESLEELSKTAAGTRELLSSDAAALAQRGFIDGVKLRALKGPIGYRNLAFDLFTLAALLRDNWAKVAGKTAVQLSELDAAETLADRLLTAVGNREQGPAIVAETSDIRQRAFTLFVKAYDDVRRAVSFLRWHDDDADTIAPSLYAGRGNGRRKAPAQPAPTPVPAAVSGNAPAAAAKEPAAADAAPHALGLPGSSPYTTA